MDVHRLEAVVDADAVRPPRDRCAFVPADDRRPVPTQGLEVAAVLRVVGVLIQPVEGVAGDLRAPGRRRSPRGPCWRRRSRTRCHRRASRRRASASSRPCGSSIQWKPPNSLSRITPVEERDPVPGIARELVAVRPGNSGRTPPPSRSSAPGRPGTCRGRAAATSPGRMSGGSPLRSGPPPAGTSRGSAPAQQVVDPRPEGRRDPGRGTGVLGSRPGARMEEKHRRKQRADPAICRTR